MPPPDPASQEYSDIPSADPAETALFYDLTRWREQLARSIARNNLALRSAGIAIATNRILLALVFFRAAEDRGFVPEGTLAGIGHEAENRSVISGLFPYTAELYRDDDLPAGNEPEPSGDLIVDDRVAAAILRDITSPCRKYNLAAMSEETLAQVFSRYLARTVRRSATHQAAIVDTHDTTLSRGTAIPPLPAFRYMAEHAIEGARKGRSPRDPLPIRMLDPACEAGSAVLAAYRRLLTLSGRSPTPDERREILLQSIHGVDISPHAVATTRMLLFFLLMGDRHPRHSPEPAPAFLDSANRIFRTLRHSIRCGNALIGPEITADESWMFCPVRDRHSLNPVSWNDQFTEVRAAGGFDAVIGNPPEGTVEEREWIQQYFQRHYATYHPAADRSAYFVEKGLSLLRPGGTLSFLMGTRWLRGDGGSPLRALLLTRQIVEIAEFSDTELCNLQIRHAAMPVPFMVVRGDLRAMQPERPDMAGQERFPVDPAGLNAGGWSLCDTREEEILRKVERSGTPFEHFCMGETGCGTAKRFDERLFLDAAQREHLVKRDRRSTTLIRPFIAGSRIGRYDAGGTGRYMIFLPAGLAEEGASREKKSMNRWFRDRYPAIARHLKDLAPISTVPAGGEALSYETPCREVFRTRDQPKILFPCRCIAPVFTYDAGTGVIDRDAGYIVTSSLYLLGILNSRLARFWFTRKHQKKNSAGLIVTADALAEFYIHTPDFDRPEEIARHSRIESFARKMLAYHEQLAREPDEPKREWFRIKIDRTNRQIDGLVYELYGLTPEEIAFVDSSSS
nr:TaqI-like C-terminal specificity domain-containing protein [uncultured Methanoregula sp.]